MSLKDVFLSSLGVVKEDDYRAAEALVDRLSEELAQSKRTIAQLKQRLEVEQNARSAIQKENSRLKDAGNQMLARQEWCSSQLVDFPPGTPVGIHEETLRHLRGFLGPGASLFDLSNPERFSTAAQWALYWCVAHACRAATRAAQVAKDENGISRDFLAELDTQAKAVSTLTDESAKLQIAYNAIFEQSEPAMKEAAVGADILLIIAGQQLVPNGLARVFWIQAKKPSIEKSPFTLRYDQGNKKGLQVDALSNVHKPARGSFGLYSQYSSALPYVPVVSVRALPREDGTLATDLSTIGVRMPEFLVMYACGLKTAGAFADTAELRGYLDEVSDMKPLYIVTATVEGPEYRRELAKGHLLSEVSDYYRKKLGLTQNLRRGRDRGYEFEM